MPVSLFMASLTVYLLAPFRSLALLLYLSPLGGLRYEGETF